MDIWPFLISFIIICAAELGDKTQLLTLGFSIRFPLWQVIIVVVTATAILMGIAVMLGDAINYYFPEFYLQLFAGIIFIIFGIWILRGDDEEGERNVKIKNPILFMFFTFFLAELGDKTQLAALTLSVKYGRPFRIWLGATLGMASVNILAAFLGHWIKKYISPKTVRWVSAAIFIIFGIVTLWSLFII